MAEASLQRKVLSGLLTALAVSVLGWGVWVTQKLYDVQKEDYLDLRTRLVYIEKHVNGQPSLLEDGKVWTIQSQKEFANYVVTYVDLKTDVLDNKILNNKDDIEFIIQQLHRQRD